MEGSLLKIGGWTYLAPEGARAQDLPGLFDAAALRAAGARQAGGRGQALAFSRDGRGCYLRHYMRGGLWGRLARDRFLSFMPRAHRAFDEFRLLASMLEEGLPVPEPVAARERGRIFIRQDIVVGAIDAEDLSKVIARRPLGKEELERLGEAIGSFFDAGVMHTDLNIRNILLSGDGRFYLVDFDKCYRCSMGLDERKAVLSRLRRSFLKEKNRTGGKANYNDSDFALIVSKAMRRAGTV
ncbi:MAG: 3-deoxy-D-manno-octulosonic acid kinase [Succinivibrio sp.]